MGGGGIGSGSKGRFRCSATFPSSTVCPRRVNSIPTQLDQLKISHTIAISESKSSWITDSDGIATNWVYFGCFCDLLSLFGPYTNSLSWWILLWQLLSDSDGIFYGEPVLPTDWSDLSVITDCNVFLEFSTIIWSLKNQRRLRRPESPLGERF